jgi:hypothetical protein
MDQQQFSQATTVRFSEPDYSEVKRLAAEEKRPIGNLIRKLVSDALAARRAGQKEQAV